MKNVISLVVLLIMFGCSSSDKRSTEVTNDEFANIENSDFKTPAQVPLVTSADLFEGEVADYDALSKESLARLPEPKLEAFEGSSEPLTKGLSYCYRRDFKKGYAVLDSIYRTYQKHPGYWNQLGTCYFLQGNLRKAFLYYNKSRDLKKTYAPPINNLGVLYQREGKDQKALAAYKKSSSNNKFSLTPDYNLAQLYLKYGFISKAEKIFSNLYRLKSNDADVLNAYATCKLFKGDFNGAVKIFEEIDKDKLKKANISVNFAIALKQIGRPKDAKSVLSMISNQGSEIGDYVKKVRDYVEK